MGEALAAAAIWLLFFAAAVVITAVWPPPAAARPQDGLPPDGPRPEGAPAGAAARPPAFLNLCVTRGKLDEAAYAATILGLAAHGVLVLTQPEGGQLRCALPPVPVDDPGLAPCPAAGPGPPRPACGRLTARRRSRPWPAGCTADVPGTWDPFERAVRRAAPGTRSYASLAAGRGDEPAGHGRRHARSTRLSPPSRPGRTPACGPPTALGFPRHPAARLARSCSVARQDRLTGSGAALAAWCATAVAEWAAVWLAASLWRRDAARESGGAPREGGGGARSHAGGRHQAPGAWREQARRAAGGGQGRHFRAFEPLAWPRAAWSSHSGEWRMVDVPSPGLPLRNNAVALLAAAAWAGLLCYPASLLPGMALWLAPAVLAAANALALARWLAQPAEATFDGQVIARWVERRGSGDDDVHVPCFAVDDGQRAWSADTSRGVFGLLVGGGPVRRPCLPPVREAAPGARMSAPAACPAPPCPGRSAGRLPA